jgi:hypothetical protein
MRASAAPVSSSSDKSATCGKLPTASQPASLAPASSLQQQPPTYDDLMAEMEVTYEALSRRMGSSSSSSSSSGGGSKGSMEEAGVSGPSEAGNGDIRSSSSSSSSSSSRGSVEADQGAKEVRGGRELGVTEGYTQSCKALPCVRTNAFCEQCLVCFGKDVAPHQQQLFVLLLVRTPS